MSSKDTPQGLLLLANLPLDVLIEIFKWVPILGMLKLRRVSSHFGVFESSKPNN